MVFNSYVFLLVFLPSVVFIYNIACNKCQNKNILSGILLVASIIFYGYANIKCLFVLFVNIIINYSCYYQIQRRGEDERVTKNILWGGIVINILVLLYFKYYNFFVGNLNWIFRTDLEIREIVLPLGISFMIFQQIAFLVDARRGEISGCSFLEYSLFITYFPHVSSGPIILHGDFWPKLKDRNKMDWNLFATGIYLFVIGLGKKVLIADTFAKAVNWGYSNISELNSTSVLFVSVAYSIQIYYDFSGYSDMAIGISRMLRMDLPINFNSPYKAKTILEFWDRWHISLTRFLTKYLYIPLGGNRKGTVRMYLNTLIVFLCSGIWHGANWTFVIWGGLHGCFMIFTKLYKKQLERIPSIINHIITLFFVNFTWIIFRAESFKVFRQMMNVLFQFKWGALNENICSYFVPLVARIQTAINIPSWIWVVVILLVILYITLKWRNVQECLLAFNYSKITVAWIVLIVIACVFSLSGMSTFIYAGF